MGQCGEELVLATVGLSKSVFGGPALLHLHGKRLKHVVEGDDQHTHLIAAGSLDPQGVVTILDDATRDRSHLDDGPRDGRVQLPKDQRRHCQATGACKRENPEVVDHPAGEVVVRVQEERAERFTVLDNGARESNLAHVDG